MALERVTTVPELPKRPADSHKGMFGSVLILAGGRGMAGAAAMAGASALRSGAGLVRIACPAGVQPTVASFEPSYMTYPLGEDAEGLIDFEPARRALTPLLSSATVLAMGPGLGRSDGLRSLVRWVLDSVEIPTVLDADALNALEGVAKPFAHLRRPVVVTPHPGEFARLTGRSVAEIQADREGAASELAEAENLTVVLKGNGTVVADRARIYVNTTGNPGMAKGGSGDVLTGVIAAMLAQKLPPFEAAQLGVYAHGLAGDMARDQNGEVGMIAGDIVDVLADVFFHLGGG